MQRMRTLFKMLTPPIWLGASNRVCFGQDSPGFVLVNSAVNCRASETTPFLSIEDYSTSKESTKRLPKAKNSYA